MEVYDVIQNRRSIRKFKDIPIEMSKIGKILDAGRLSPTAGNLQDCKFILVKDKEKIESIAKACLEQYWINSASVVIVICSDPEKTRSHYNDRGDMFSYHDAAAATMSMILTIHSLNLATCWVGAFEDEMLRRELKIPDDIFINAILPIGYADEKPSCPPKLTLEDNVFVESFGNKMKDPAGYFQWTGEYVNQAVKKGKEVINKISKKLSK